jgi:hypothetical protein
MNFLDGVVERDGATLSTLPVSAGSSKMKGFHACAMEWR